MLLSFHNRAAAFFYNSAYQNTTILLSLFLAIGFALFPPVLCYCLPETSQNIYSIQIGSFQNKKNAQQFFNSLLKKGYTPFVKEKMLEGKNIYQVYVGKFDSKKAAYEVAEKLRANEGLSPVLMTCCAASQALPVLTAESTGKLSSATHISNRRHENTSQRQRGKFSSIKQSSLLRVHNSLSESIPLKLYAEFEPSFSWRLYYEDNVYGTAKNHVSDFSNRYLPKIKLNLNSERLKISGEGELEIIEYVDERDYNTVDQDYTVEATYTLTKRSVVTFSGNYSVNTDPNRYFQLEPEDVGSLALVGTYVVKKYKTKTKTGIGSYQYMLSPRSTITGMLTYSNFDTGVTDSSDFYMGSLIYVSNLSSHIKLNINGSYNYMRFKFGGKAEEGDTDFLEDLLSGGDYDVFFGSDFKSKTYVANSGLSYLFNKDSSINFSFGWSKNIQNIKTEATDPETGELIITKRRPDGNTLNYNVVYTRRFSGTKLKMGIKQGTGDNANTGASFRSRELSYRIEHEFTRRLNGILDIKYYRYHADKNDFGFEIKRNILYTNASIKYQTTRWLDVILTYQYTNNHNKQVKTRTERNSIFASLTIHPLRPFVFR